MCGFTGVFGKDVGTLDRSIIQEMAKSLYHRGPDSQGYFYTDFCHLGFRRLSIVDLDYGNQPMSDDKDLVLVFNGEIYNHRELRSELEAEGCYFKTAHSDTEVLLNGWSVWGEKILPKLNGMFAFAIYNKRTNVLTLGRDRFGIKPLYIAKAKNLLIFASEIKAIHSSNLLARQPNNNAILEYFTFQNLWSSQTLFDKVEVLPAGTIMRITPESSKQIEFWDITFNRDSKLSFFDAENEHRFRLEKAVKLCSDADVEVASYLSGGIDSSAISLFASQKNENLRTFSCIFDLDNVLEDKVVDERDFSRKVAYHIGSKHREFTLSADSLERMLDLTIRALEIPMMGMSYANYFIAENVSRHNKVVLSGTGGDELHAGYIGRYKAILPDIYFNHSRKASFQKYFWQRRPLRDRIFEKYVKIVNFLIPEESRKQVFTDTFLYEAGDFSTKQKLREIFDKCKSDNLIDKILYTDVKTYLHGLLVLEDKLSMAHGLEARLPLLDNDLVELVTSLPHQYLLSPNQGKIIFRQSLRNYFGSDICDKPKMGFGPPDASWYRTVLRPFIEDFLSVSSVKSRGIFQPSFVEKVLLQHFSGKINNAHIIWSLLSFESWCRQNDFFV